jgi:hypothetical protein
MLTYGVVEGGRRGLPGMQCSDEVLQVLQSSHLERCGACWGRTSDPQGLQPSQLDPRKPCEAHARSRNACNPRSLTRARLARLTQGPATVAGLGARGSRLATNARHERRPAPLGTLATWLATPRLPGCQIAGRATRTPLELRDFLAGNLAGNLVFRPVASETARARPPHNAAAREEPRWPRRDMPAVGPMTRAERG